MAKLSKDEINQFFASGTWKEMEERFKSQLLKVDQEIENADPFTHGWAVGERRTLKTFLGMKEILLTEADGKGPYSR